MNDSVISDHVADFLAFLRVECGLSPNTLAAYRRDLRDLAVNLAGTAGHAEVQAGAITPADLSAHLRWLRTDRNLSATSICRHLAAIRMFFRFLCADGRIVDNPTEILERPTRWQRLPDALSPVQMRRLLEAPNPQQGELYLRDKALLEAMYAAGLRATEAAGLGVTSLNEKTRALRIMGKGNRERMVPIGRPAALAIGQYVGQLRPILLQRQRGSECGRLFLSRTGRPLERIAVWQIVRRQARAAGLAGVHPHQLRHSFATHLVNGGANLRAVQELLGHADIHTTQTYTHVDATRLRAVHRQYHPRS